VAWGLKPKHLALEQAHTDERGFDVPLIPSNPLKYSSPKIHYYSGEFFI
jgi:hypothetical protein